MFKGCIIRLMSAERFCPLTQQLDQQTIGLGKKLSPSLRKCKFSGTATGARMVVSLGIV